MFGNIKADIKRYMVNGASLKKIFYLAFIQGLWALFAYRFGYWAGKIRIPLLGHICRLLYFFLNKLVEIMAGISISSDAEIGKGLYVGHFGGIFINSGAKLGENCNIGQGVTIGNLGLGRPESPVIGNNVYIGAGAKILGGITIGDNVRIGANAVVTKDVPDNATAVGVPARIVKIKPS